MMLGMRWTGVDTTTAIDVAGTGHNGSFGTTDDVASITTVTDAAVHIICVAPAQNDQTSITATGYSTAQEMSANQRRASALYKSITSAGATGTVTVTFTSSDVANDFSFALRPVAAAAGQPTSKRLGGVQYVGLNSTPQGQVW